MRRLTTFGLVLATAALIAACSSSSTGLTGKTWQLTAITELVPAFQGVVPAADQPNYTIEFKSDGTFNAKADCNTTSGAYTTTSSGGLTILPGPDDARCVSGRVAVSPIPRGTRQRRELRGRQQPADDHAQGRRDARLQVGRGITVAETAAGSVEGSRDRAEERVRRVQRRGHGLDEERLEGRPAGGHAFVVTDEEAAGIRRLLHVERTGDLRLGPL